VRDAAQMTQLVFALVKNKETAIYQLEEGMTYQRWEARQNRKKIKWDDCTHLRTLIEQNFFHKSY
jgi:hypothetical protein